MGKINIEKDKDITSYTTFGVPVKARFFAEYSSEKELLAISRSDEFLENETLHIGGGSNLLFVENFNGLVLHSAIKGMNVYKKNEERVFAIVGAGEKWTDFVDWCVDNGLQGVENMAGIPGEVGAAPVQNVGAYGMEASDTIFAVECFDTQTRTTVRFSAEECGFGYRDSFFKHAGKNRYYVLRVSFLLKLGGKPDKLDYGPLRELKDRLGDKVTLRDVAEKIKETRGAKLPDPSEIGSAGSFFKNPVVAKYFYDEEIKPFYPDMPVYEAGEGRVKLSAGWMIDHAGLKGKRVGAAEVFPRQALVIVNNGDASAADVVALADYVRKEVRHRFKVELQPEVNFIDSTMYVTILGSGTSKGIPEIGCRCDRCMSGDSRDKRLRASAFVKVGGLNLLIDASPDLRYQALREDISKIDAVLLTHSHYDHVGGVDDLRPFCAGGKLPIFAREDVDRDLRKRVDYCFREQLYPGVPAFDMKIIDDSPFYIDGVRIVPVNVMHGKLPIYGYRIGDFAYITDAKYLEEEEREKLYGLKVLIVNALRERPRHFAHFTLEEALELIQEVKPEKAYITHICHDMSRHEYLERKLPENVFVAYDGLKLKIK